MLLYPNPTDPLNNEAANLQLKNEEQYNKKIKEYIEQFASSHRKGIQKAEDDVEEEKAGENVNTNHSSDHKKNTGKEG